MTYGKKIIVSMSLIFVAISIDAINVSTIRKLSDVKVEVPKLQVDVLINPDDVIHPDEVFVYDGKTKEGIIISKKIFLLSKAMKNFMQDFPSEPFYELEYQTVYIFRLLKECGLNIEMFEKI